MEIANVVGVDRLPFIDGLRTPPGSIASSEVSVFFAAMSTHRCSCSTRPSCRPLELSVIRIRSY